MSEAIFVLPKLNKAKEGVRMPKNPVATVNGKNIYSDKNMIAIIDSYIEFSDGSWCDVSTGQVVNLGPGYISIGSPAEDSDRELIVFGPERFQASMLEVRGIEAEVEVQPTDEQEMTVTIKGPKYSVDSISIHQSGDSLVVEPKNSGGRRGHGADITIRGGSVSIGGGSVSIGGVRGGRIVSGRNTVIMSGDGGGSDTKVTISVPRGTSVNTSGVQGKVNIGNIESSLNASVLGGDDIRAGSVRDAVLTIQGGGNIIVDSVDGNLSMTIQGSGDVRVRNGNVGMLNASVVGSGDASFGGQATNASLSIIGSGDIKVSHVENRPSRNVVGSGDISVGNW
jgi:hypothetical protein